MKTIFLRNWKYTALALFMVCLFTGCSTKRHNPNPIPRFVTDYREQFVYERLNRLPVRLELPEFDKLDSCIMVDSGSTIGVTSYELLPFKSIVKREFEEFISNNFSLVGDGVKANLVLEVVPSNYDVKRNDTDDVECTMSFDVIFKAATDEPGKPLFTQIHRLTCNASVEYHDIEGIVPCSIYAAIQKVVKHCIKQISVDANLMSTLGTLVPIGIAHGPMIYDEPIKMPAGRGSYYYKENASVVCNDEVPDKVRKWAMKEIKDRWQHKRLFRYPCVFFSRAEFAKEERLWKFNYDIIEWNEFIVIPDLTTSGRTGRCFLDSRIVANDDKKARGYMKNRMIDWFEDEKGHKPGKVELRNFHQDKNNSGFRMAEYECR